MGGERYIDRKRNRKKKRKRAKRDEWAGRERKGKRKKRKLAEGTKRGRGKDRMWTKRAVGRQRNRRRVEWAGKGMGTGNGVAREDREAWISAAGGVPEEREAPDGGCCIL